MKLFDLDSPIMRTLSRVADLMLLNALALICCIPVVTAGASFTAMHYVSLKLARGEEGYIAKSFFKSFKQNFRQATVIWLIFLLVLAVLIGDYIIMGNVEGISNVIRVIVTIVAIIVLFTSTFVFPVLAKFDNTIGATIKNAFVISLIQFPKTILMFILNWIPWILLVTVIQIVPLCILFGFSAPAYASAFLYKKFFQKLEDQIVAANGGPVAEEENEDDDERIFHDELQIGE